MDAAKSFQEHRHVYLSGAVPRDKCEELTNHMFRLFEEGKLEKDPQCPLSASIIKLQELHHMLFPSHDRS